MTDKLQNLFDDILNKQDTSANKLPPVDKWNPPLSGDMDLVIKRDGTWLHDGSTFKRTALVDLFSRVLKREGDEYFLVTPVEKWRISVEDVPFHVNKVEKIVRDGISALRFTTTTGDEVVAGKNNPLRVVIHSETQEPSPYLLIRNNLEGLINRAVFYELVTLALDDAQDINEPASSLVISSLGESFKLGNF